MAPTPTIEQDLPTEVPDIEKQDRPVLCVDLDGTLLATDTFLESTILLFKRNPLSFLFFIPLWACKGLAFLKQQVANRISLDVASLPYRQDVLGFIRQEFRSGRRLVLATGADQKFAKAVGEHLNIFSDIMASDGKTNFIGSNKRQGLEMRFGLRGFDYIGNDSPDLEVWKSANGAIIVSSSTTLLEHTAQHTPVLQCFPQPSPTFTTFLKALRIHQWIKNTIIFLPLLTAQMIFETGFLASACMAFLCFGFCASGIYVFNDLLDLPADRRHPKKKERPFASGSLPIPIGLLCLPALISGSFILAWATLPPAFLTMLILYGLTTTAYSLYLKQLMMVDVLTLASLYSLRIFAGGVAVGISVSSWLLAFSMFFFLSLAFAKRHGELQFRKVSKNQGVERRAYIGEDKAILGTMGTISGYMSVLVFALYINDQEVASSYRHPEMLWLACPLLLYWISRTWLLAHRGLLDDDPLVVAFRDPRTYLVTMVMGICGFIAL
jgi:4-hydroxybenzoate polyprenyltransferase